MLSSGGSSGAAAVANPAAMGSGSTNGSTGTAKGSGSNLAAFALASLPSVGVLWMVYAMGRLLAEEEDEYQRHRHIRASLFGLGTLLTLATIWGFFEQFDLVPHVPTWAAVPVFALGLGFASCSPWRRS